MAISWVREGGKWAAVAGGLVLTLLKTRRLKKRAGGETPKPELGPQLVWSGPETSAERDTRRVYEDLFTSAKRSLWVLSYAYRDGPHVFGELAKHLDATPGLEVTLVLNIERWQREKKHRIKKVVARFADRFWKKEWPGQNRPLVYYDRRSVNKQLPSKLHAKVVVADEEHVFVTSANLTRRAWDDNVELGILVRDADLAGSVIAHVQGLIDARVLWKLPRETGPAAS